MIRISILCRYIILGLFSFANIILKLPAAGYDYNPHVPIELWMQLKPYFLPTNHPKKKVLDQIFAKARVTQSKDTFVKAGFSITRNNRPINAHVSGHPKLKGYLIKAYLDSQFAIPEWQMWLRRIHGIEVIRACIKKHGYTQFTLPKKWIYPLPAEPSPPLGDKYNRKNFILVVENMQILKGKDNKKAYKQQMTKPLLTALYTVMKECQLTDCVYIGNMPFTLHGNITFIDTELFNNGTPNFAKLKKNLTIPMQNHLDRLMQE